MAVISLVPSLYILLVISGLAPLLGFKIDEYTIIVVAITTGLTIDYTIHVLNSIQKRTDASASQLIFSSTVSRGAGVPVFLSFLTSLLALATLFLSSFSTLVLPLFFAPAEGRAEKKV
jgi:predicted RND superfamily exporter protein